MPSFRSRLLSGTIKSVKPWLTGMDIPRQRRGMTMLGRLLPKPRDVQVEKAAEIARLTRRWAAQGSRWKERSSCILMAAHMFPVRRRPMKP